MEFDFDDTNPVDVLSELLNADNIEMKTDLDIGQIKVLMQLKWMAVLKDEDNKNKEPFGLFVDEVVPYVMMLYTSYKRKRSEEIVKGVTEMKEALMMQGLMDKK